MKTLNIYLQEYIEESLLDDIDDLEKVSDKNVANANCIGKKYKIYFAREDGQFLANFDQKALKKLKFEFDGGPFRLYRNRRLMNKASTLYQCIGNMVLNADLSLLKESTYEDKSETKTELIKKLYSCSYLDDNKGFLQISVNAIRYTSGSGEAWAITIFNDQDQTAINFSLNKK